MSKDHGATVSGQIAPLALVLEQVGEHARQLGRLDDQQTAPPDQGPDHPAEVTEVGTHHGGRSECNRLRDIRTVQPDETSSHDRDVREVVEGRTCVKIHSLPVTGVSLRAIDQSYASKFH